MGFGWKNRQKNIDFNMRKLGNTKEVLQKNIGKSIEKVMV